MAVGTIYNYFKNKEDILNHIFQVEYEKRAAFFARLQEQDIHPLEKIRAILTMHFAEVRENPELVRVILEEKGFSRRYYQQGPDGNKGLQGFLERIIREGIGQGKLRDCDPAMVATVLFGAIEGVMARYLFTLETGEGADLLGGAVEEITALLAQGLAAPAIRGGSLIDPQGRSLRMGRGRLFGGATGRFYGFIGRRESICAIMNEISFIC